LSIWPDNLEQAGLNTKRIILYYNEVLSEILSDNYNKNIFTLNAILRSHFFLLFIWATVNSCQQTKIFWRMMLP